MATFTVTAANTNYDSLATKTGDDTFNINGGGLIIDTDTRYCANSSSTIGTIGPMTISATLGGTILIDGTNVRLIPYNTGSGNVPAIGTTVSQGGVSSYLLGVWSALNVAPTTSGSAMPASGYIKVKNKTGGNFASGALTGIGANATGADVVGWIEVVGVEGRACTVPRFGTFTATGAWFQAGTTNGSANQQIQLPSSLANTYWAGVYIETAASSGVYEFWPCVGSATSIATDSRGKVVWISSQGLVTIGHNGTGNAGYVPSSGLNIRVPNIITINTNSTSGFGTNVLPHDTLSTRYDFLTTGGGVIDIDIMNFAWQPIFEQAYSVSISNAAIISHLEVSEIATEFYIGGCGVGPVAAQVDEPLTLDLCFVGGTIENCTWGRYSLTTSGVGVNTLTDNLNLTVINNVSIIMNNRTSGSAGAWELIRVQNSTFTDCIHIGGGRVIIDGCDGITFTDTIFADRISGTTDSSNAGYVVSLYNACKNITFDGVTFGGWTNVQPYSGLFHFDWGGHENIKFRNVGTYASPLDLGSSNAAGYIFDCRAGSASSDVKIQRIYVTNTRTGAWNVDNSNSNITFENVFSDYADASTANCLNSIFKGVGSTPSLAAQSSVYGTHFFDCHTSTTAGRVGIYMNEYTTVSPSSSSVAFTGGTPMFTSAGGLYMPVIGDQVVFTMPYYAIGHTAFQNAAATMAGGTIGNYTLEYQLDTGSGFGSWTTLNGTNLSAETIDYQDGFKLKVRITTSTTNTSAITSLYILTTSTTTSQAEQYPLDVVDADLVLTGLQSGTEVHVYRTSDDVQLDATESSGTSYTYSYQWLGTDIDVYITVLKIGYQILRYEGQLLTEDGLTIPAFQQVDRNYLNP